MASGHWQLLVYKLNIFSYPGILLYYAQIDRSILNLYISLVV